MYLNLYVANKAGSKTINISTPALAPRQSGIPRLVNFSRPNLSICPSVQTMFNFAVFPLVEFVAGEECF